MRCLFALVFCAIFLLPQVSPALLFTVSGNQPVAANLYTEWPGLVKLANHQSRTKLTWFNANQSIQYAGSFEQLQTAIHLYSQSEIPTHRIIVRPGDSDTTMRWLVEIDVRRTHDPALDEELGPIRDYDPTLTIYWNPSWDLDALQLPENATIEGLGDFRERVIHIQTAGSDDAKKCATHVADALDRDPVRETLGVAEYEKIEKHIQAFIRGRSQQDHKRLPTE